MLKIAVLDDTPIFREKVKKKLQSVYAEMHVAVEIYEFTFGKELFYEVDDGAYYDIFILDIELPDMLGTEVARRLREASPASYIIFLTAYGQFAIEGYDLKAYQYILKDVWEEKLPQTLRDIQKEISDQKDPAYLVTVSTKQEKLPIRDIYYCYKDGKNAVFNTKMGLSSVRKTLSQIYEELPKEAFIFIDRGYIVNLDNVMKLKNRELYMSNGDVLFVSKPQLETVKGRLCAYWSKDV